MSRDINSSTTESPLRHGIHICAAKRDPAQRRATRMILQDKIKIKKTPLLVQEDKS